MKTLRFTKSVIARQSVDTHRVFLVAARTALRHAAAALVVAHPIQDLHVVTDAAAMIAVETGLHAVATEAAIVQNVQIADHGLIATAVADLQENHSTALVLIVALALIVDLALIAATADLVAPSATKVKQLKFLSLQLCRLSKI